MDTLAKVQGSFNPDTPPLKQFLPRESPMEMTVSAVAAIPAAGAGFGFNDGMAAACLHPRRHRLDDDSGLLRDV